MRCYALSWEQKYENVKFDYIFIYLIVISTENYWTAWFGYIVVFSAMSIFNNYRQIINFSYKVFILFLNKVNF